MVQAIEYDDHPRYWPAPLGKRGRPVSLRECATLVSALERLAGVR